MSGRYLHESSSCVCRSGHLTRAAHTVKFQSILRPTFMRPLSRFRSRCVSLLAIVALAAAQLAVAAYACPMEFQAGEAPAVAADDSGNVAAMPALCEKHCEDEQQTINQLPAVLPALAPPSAVAILQPAVGPDVRATATAFPWHLQSAPPPLAIRHCCFRL